MNEKELLHNQAVNCPECHNDIMIVLGTPEVITLEEFKKRSQEQMKAMKEWKEKNKN